MTRGRTHSRPAEPRPQRSADYRPARAIDAGAEIVVAIEERWYRVDITETGGRWRTRGPIEVGNRQFVLADPDGYLWRPFRDLGERAGSFGSDDGAGKRVPR